MQDRTICRALISYPDDNDVGGYTGREVRPDAEELTSAEAEALINTFFDYDYDLLEHSSSQWTGA